MQIVLTNDLRYFNNKVLQQASSNDTSASGQRPIRTRIVICDTAGSACPDIRARLVAYEVGETQEAAYVASTRPLEALLLLFSQYAAESKRDSPPLRMSFVDVRKAYVHGIPQRALQVYLPKEMGLGPGGTARLVRCMYRTRDAGHILGGNLYPGLS